MGTSLGPAEGLILRDGSPEIWGRPKLVPALSLQPWRRGSSHLLPTFAQCRGQNPATWQLLTLCIPLLHLPRCAWLLLTPISKNPPSLRAFPGWMDTQPLRTG